jgi:sec-independent protein translocase protein TatC
MPFWSHVHELRTRFIVAVSAVVVLTSVAFVYISPLFNALLWPLPHGVQLFFTGVAEAFMVKFKLAFVVGFVASSPIVAGQLWGFVRPALLRNEVKRVVPIVPAVILLFLAGTVFTFFLVIPPAVFFLLKFSGERLQPILTFDSYFSFVVRLSVAGGLLFEMPVFLAFLAKLGLVTYGGLAKRWRIAVVIVLVLAAVLAPTADAITMSIFAAPIIALYFVSMFVVKLIAPVNK